jgi:hypothetical protein
MPKTRLSIPLNDGVLSILRIGVKLSCEPPRVNAHHLIVLLFCGNIEGSKTNSSPDRVPPPSWRHRPRNWRAIDGGGPRIMATSCSITVVSPHGRWNVWVSGCHRFTNAVNTVESIIRKPPMKRRASSRNLTRCMNDTYCSSHVRGCACRS